MDFFRKKKIFFKVYQMGIQNIGLRKRFFQKVGDYGYEYGFMDIQGIRNYLKVIKFRVLKFYSFYVLEEGQCLVMSFFFDMEYYFRDKIIGQIQFLVLVIKFSQELFIVKFRGMV